MIDHADAPPVVDIRPLRFVYIGRSIVSDFGNPAATTSRAIVRALGEMGQHVTFLEERANQPTTDLLRTHGAGALRAFNRRFPDISYRTFELPTGQERLVWLGRELSVADVVIVQDIAPAGVIDAMRQGTAPHVIRVAQVTTDALPPFAADLVLASIGSDDELPFGPAVLRIPVADPASRTGVIIVAYGNIALAKEIGTQLASLGSILVSAGPTAEPPAVFVPEVELPERYAAAAAAVVVDTGPEPLAAARALLPVAAGCPAFVAGRGPSAPAGASLHLETVTTSTVLAQVRRQINPARPATVPILDRQFDAAVQAERLVREVRAIRIATRTSNNGTRARRDQQ